MVYDVIVIGGGAAGLMAAIEAAKKNKSTLILEFNKSIGQKILISGGGRCNFTNLYSSPQNYLSNNPNFMKSAFSEYTVDMFIKLVESYNIEYYEKKLGQLFCKKSSREIVNMLLSECEKYGVEIILNSKVVDINFNENKFKIQTIDNLYISKNCIVASGGLSFPKKGATDIGYKIARKFGHKIIETNPALVPLKLSDEIMNYLSNLSGISFNANVQLRKRMGKRTNKTPNFNENVLITHKGLSGPAILQISSYWQIEDELLIELEPSVDKESLLLHQRGNKKDLKTTLEEFLPNRFVDYLIYSIGHNKLLSEVSKKDKEKIMDLLLRYSIKPVGTLGYEKAEVTRGGVDTNELNQKTMESKIQKGLFFIGEVVDVTGWLGGYNFQWAWASGYVCGRAI